MTRLPTSLRGGIEFPIPVAVFILPEPLTGVARFKAAHNRSARGAMKKAVLTHHRVRIPRRFTPARQRRFVFAERQEITNRLKGSRPANLVKTGKAKRQMTGRVDVRVGGTAAGGELTGRGVMRWPPGYVAPNRGRINRDQMNREITQFTEEENDEIADEFRDEYLDLLEGEFRRRKRISPSQRKALRALGLSF